MSGGNWLKVNEIERGKYPHVKVDYVPVTCSHCAEAACVKLDQTGAIYRRADGIVLIDPEKAKGNKELVKTCPYRRIEWNEELQLAQKCTLCAHLLDAGEPEPRCVESCPSGALVFGDLDDPRAPWPGWWPPAPPRSWVPNTPWERRSPTGVCPRSSWPAPSSTVT